MSVAVQIEKVNKSYGGVVALNNINLHIRPGELFGFIGPDGSGKTSLFRIITTLLLPESGSAKVDGFDIKNDFRQIRKITGYMPGRFSLYLDLTVEENLKFYADIFGSSLTENYDLIQDIYVQLEPFKKRRAGKLSGGMKQKLALCCALIHKPRLLVLDEPTTGVDAVSRKEFWELLKKMQQKQITILVSTPYMDEASLCDRVALMQNGNLLAVNTPDEIIRQYPFNILTVSSDQMYRLYYDLEEIAGRSFIHRFGDTIHVSTDKNRKNMARQIRNFLSAKGHHAVDIKPAVPVIEDCFLALMEKTEENENS
jgi:ABC-type multidrug transport system ATPase subunit